MAPETNSPEILPEASSPERFHKLKTVGRVLGYTAIIGASAGGFINVFAETTIESGPLEFDVNTEVANLFDPTTYSGSTTLDVPPLGSVEIDTHDAPVNIVISPSSIDPSELATIGDSPQSELENLGDKLRADIAQAEDELVRKTALATGAGVLVGSLAVGSVEYFGRKKDLSKSLKALGAPLALTGLIGLAISGSAISSNRNSQDALQHAKYTGLLANAPEVIGNIYDTGERFNEQTRELADIITYLSQLSDGYQDLLVIPNGVTNVLFVSDIHSQAGTFDLIDRSIQQFNVDMVIDAGDLTEWGGSTENQFFREEIASLDVPYVITPGNHDSDSTVEVLEQIPNVVVPSGQAIEVEELYIVGSRDPRFTPDLASERNDEEDLRRQSFGLAQAISRSENTPDIAIVHDPDAAEHIYGMVPLILSGHIHHFNQTTRENTLNITSGSTGGGGLRAFENGDEATPRTAMILAFDDETKELVRVTMLDFGAIGDNRSSVEVCDVVDSEVVC